MVERVGVGETFPHARRRAVLVSEHHERHRGVSGARRPRIVVDREGPQPVGVVLVGIVRRARSLEVLERAGEVPS